MSNLRRYKMIVVKIKMQWGGGGGGGVGGEGRSSKRFETSNRYADKLESESNEPRSWKSEEAAVKR